MCVCVCVLLARNNYSAVSRKKIYTFTKIIMNNCQDAVNGSRPRKPRATFNYRDRYRDN